MLLQMPKQLCCWHCCCAVQLPLQRRSNSTLRLQLMQHLSNFGQLQLLPATQLTVGLT
jgi:hypothetical protein